MACPFQFSGLFFLARHHNVSHEKGGDYMLNRLLTLWFTSVVAFSLSMPLFAQEGSSKQEAKETSAQEKAEKKHNDNAAKQARWEGMVQRSSKDESTLTVRKVGSTLEKTIHYDNSTEWVSQKHGSKKVNKIDPSEVKDGDRVICRGTYDQSGKFQATLISKRLTK
jgi:hypothetical protein